MREFTRRRGIGFMATYIRTAAHVDAIAKRETSDDRVARMMRDAGDSSILLGVPVSRGGGFR